MNGGCDTESVYEMKNNCCVFERLFKIQKKGMFLFGISFFFVLEILTFSYYENYESDEVMRCANKMVKY